MYGKIIYPVQAQKLKIKGSLEYFKNLRNKKNLSEFFLKFFILLSNVGQIGSKYSPQNFT